MMTNVNLAGAYRPQFFHQVVGQEHAVRFLSGLIQRVQASRNILLSGTIGSGKTTLARIYLNALVCLAPTPEGSPCGVCKKCKPGVGKPAFNLEDRTEAGIFEHDVTGKGGSKDHLDRFFIKAKAKSEGIVRPVYFFDEAHGLEKEAADSLLKRIEEADGSATYIFATSEAHRMSSALRSRLVPLQIRPLTPAVAVEFMRAIAKASGIEIEDDALVLIAGLVNGQPRDLLNALDQLRDQQQKIAIDDVRLIFDMGYVDALREYVVAIGEGDENALSEIIVRWRDDPEEKLRWVQALLAGVYFLDVLNQKIEVDPVLGLLSYERSQALSTLQRRLTINSRRGLAPFWRRLLAYWSIRDIAEDDAAITLRFALFHHLVASPSDEAADATRSSRRSLPQGREQTNSPAPPSTGSPGFIGLEHVALILDRASFLTQEDALYFNASFALTPATLGLANEPDQRAAMDEFCQNLEAEFGQGPAPFAAVHLLEGNDDGDLFGYVLAHIPTEDGDGLEDVRTWNLSAGASPSGDPWAVLETGPEGTQLGRWHWRQVLNLCAGTDQSVEARDKDHTKKPVVTLLKIAPHALRNPSVVQGEILVFYGLLTAEAVSAACANGIAPLSVVSDRRWELVQTGWEAHECIDRRHAKAERERELADIALKYTDPLARDREEHRLRSSWPNDPHSRPRSWPVWWSRG